MLRKDFRHHRLPGVGGPRLGADAVLLIVAALDPAALRALLDEAAEAGLDALVEVHTVPRRWSPPTPGDPGRGERPRPGHPRGRPGPLRRRRPGRARRHRPGRRERHHDRAGVEAAAGAGADAVLVGEALVRADDPAAALRDLLAVPTWNPRLKWLRARGQDPRACMEYREPP